jgi:hypothetical protein
MNRDSRRLTFLVLAHYVLSILTEAAVNYGPSHLVSLKETPLFYACALLIMLLQYPVLFVLELTVIPETWFNHESVQWYVIFLISSILYGLAINTVIKRWRNRKRRIALKSAESSSH